MKKSLKAAAAVLACACLVPTMFVGCSKPKNDIGIDYDPDTGELIITKPKGDDVTELTFWINGDDNEIAVFGNLVREFNAIHEKEHGFKVKMVQRPGEGYANNLSIALANKTAPDIFYVGDSGYKSYAELGNLLDITDYVKMSQTYKVEDMWDNVVQRYKYDVNTYRSGADAPNGRYYGVPKDLGPTVIYYNETYFNGAGVTVISVDKDHLDAFNAGGKDDRGNTKASLGITGTVKEKGYFELNGKKFFNNQVPMSWDECNTLAQLVQDYMRTDAVGKKQGYGYFTEWWFNYGWSVGGNCIQEIPSNKYDCGYYYDFTLMDNTKNYIVADDVEGTVTVNKKQYKAGEIIAYQDKLDMSIYSGKKAADGASMYKNASNYKITKEVTDLAAEGKLNVLPSQREAFTEFVRVGSDKSVEVDTGMMGYGICPRPTDIGNDAAKSKEFQAGNLGMLVDGRWNVTEFRKNISKFDWDVAPLPMYKEYDADGNITVHGVEAGHSGSVALCIPSNCKVPNAAWLFIEYVGGVDGQTKQAEAGFAIPLQKNIANSEVFLQSDKKPRNSKIFIRATEYEIAGDWWFLQDNKWIDEWANELNGSVRNGKTTLTQFFNGNTYAKTFGLLDKYTK